MTRLSSVSFLQRMVFASQTALWSVPQPVLYIHLRVSRSFWGKWLLLHKKFFEGFCQLCFTYISQSPPGRSGADPSWAAKRFPGRFHQGCTKVSPRFHQGCYFRKGNRKAEGSPNCSLHVSPSFLVDSVLREFSTSPPLCVAL